MSRRWKYSVTALLCAAAVAAGGTGADAGKVRAGTRQIKAALQSDTVKVGKTTSVRCNDAKDADSLTFSSSDSTVAYVNKNGVITGKKAGKVQIKVSGRGFQAKKLDLTVKQAANLPELPVAFDEVELQGAKMTKNSSGGYNYSAVFKNKAKKETVRKIAYYYQVTVLVPFVTVQKPQTPDGSQTDTGSETPGDAENTGAGDNGTDGDSSGEKTVTTYKKEKKTVVLRASSIKAGKKSKRVSCTGDHSGKLQSMKLTKAELYAGDALYEYNAKKKTGTLKWGRKDTQAPKFSGWVGKESCYNKEPIRICYSDRKKTYKFKDHVTATDNRDGKVSFKVDASKINWNKEGIYKVYYTAKDKAGNVGKAYAKVQVYIPDTAENVADEVLRSVIKKNWSDEKKLRAIYKYAKGHCSYVDNGTHKDWRKAGLHGIRYQSGDCFTYYAVAKLLISRAGIYNLTVTRYPVASAHHWWNLVYVRGGWYHLDTTPRQRDGKFCLVTDAQLRGYSSGLTFSFDKKKYPDRAVKKISPNP